MSQHPAPRAVAPVAVGSPRRSVSRPPVSAEWVGLWALPVEEAALLLGLPLEEFLRVSALIRSQMGLA